MSTSRQFTEVMVQNQIGALRRVHGMLEADGVRNRDQFFDMMSAVFGRGGLDLRDLSDELGFSFSTVYRWLERRSAPHSSLWPRIVDWVLTALLAKIRELELSCERERELV